MKVNEQRFAWDKEIKELGEQGLYHRAIARIISERYKTTFTTGMVSYRLSIMGVSTKDYREGVGGYAVQAKKRARARILALKNLIRSVREI